VSTSAAIEKRVRAKLASDALIGVDGVTGICVYGSVARGQANEDSDIDVLVVGTDPKLRPSVLHKLLPEKLRDGTVTISYYTWAELSEYLKRSPRFGAHLQREGWIVHDLDGKLARVLGEERPIDTSREVTRQLRLLRTLSHTDRFGGRFLFPLAQVYRIGRTVTYAQLASRGVLEFDQQTAFRRLAAAVPEWTSEISTIARLAPFYARTRSRSTKERFPFDPNGNDAAAEFRQAYNAVLTIADEKPQGRVS